MIAFGFALGFVAHLAVFLLPGVAVTVLARPLWRADRLSPLTVVLLAAGFVAEVSFFAFYVTPGLGQAWTIVVVAASLGVLLRPAARPAIVRLTRRRDVRVPLVLGLGTGLLFTGSLVLHGGYEHPSTTSNSRYLVQLPIDNLMPFFLADRVLRGADVEPFVGDWKSSDRPPLQAGAFTFAHPLQFALSGEAHYQLTGMVLQSLWIGPLWLLLRRLRVPRRVVTPVVAVAALSGVALLYTVFVWPKLLSAAYGLVVLAELVPARPGSAGDVRTTRLVRAGAVGAAFGLAMLAHGGAFFLVPPLLLTTAAVSLVRRRSSAVPAAPLLSAVGLVLSAAVVLGPWSAYQRWVAPPGNRLVKWHLAGAVAIDERSTVAALRDAYTKPPLSAIVRRKRSNFSFLANERRMAGDVVPVTGSMQKVREREFGQLFNALGVPWFGVLAAVACVALRSRRHRPLVDVAAVVTGFAAVGIATWCLLLYGPRATFVHQGYLALVLLLMVGLSLFVAAIDHRLAWVLVALGSWRLVRVWLLAPPATAQGAPVSRAAPVLLALGAALVASAFWDGVRPRPRIGARVSTPGD